MKNKTIISDFIEQYHFKDEQNPKLDVNITVLISGENALLIDTGYIRHGEEVLAELEKSKIQVTDIILSHYHPDHAAGVSVFKGARCYCSEHYLDNYRLCSEVWDKNTPYTKASEVIKSEETLDFGGHRLKFYDSKSHSADSLIIEIDEEFLFVGDLIMKDVDDKVTFPYICKDGDLHKYLESLKMIREMKDHKLLLAHGTVVKDEGEIQNIVEDHENYFNMLITPGDPSMIEAIVPHWSFSEWHLNNLEVIKNFR